MIAPNIARRYAKALLEIGAETGTLESLVTELDNLAAAYQASAELRAAMENPLVAREGKVAILEELGQRLSLSKTSHSLLLILGSRRRLPALPGIAQRLREMNDLKKGIIRAEVTTAVVLSDAYYERLQAELEKMTGNKVTLDKREDPSIIAGVVTRIGDTIVDGSLRTRLLQMKHTLLQDS
ncbi:MAG: ATP synthase F1 subunit delta [Polyangiaceae bacterium]